MEKKERKRKKLREKGKGECFLGIDYEDLVVERANNLTSSFPMYFISNIPHPPHTHEYAFCVSLSKQEGVLVGVFFGKWVWQGCVRMHVQSPVSS